MLSALRVNWNGKRQKTKRMIWMPTNLVHITNKFSLYLYVLLLIWAVRQRWLLDDDDDNDKNNNSHTNQLAHKHNATDSQIDKNVRIVINTLNSLDRAVAIERREWMEKEEKSDWRTQLTHNKQSHIASLHTFNWMRRKLSKIYSIIVLWVSEWMRAWLWVPYDCRARTKPIK